MTNVQKLERSQRYERLVRRIRQRIFDYDDNKEVKASRVLRRAITIYVSNRPDTTVYAQDGSTHADRVALAKHGIAWGD